MPNIPRIAELHEEMTAWRQALHAHPQTAFEEIYASDFVAAKLQEFGLKVHRGLAKTGVVGTLQGSKQASGRLSAIGLRADIDALDVEERNDVPYKSQHPGKMHACGHDGHTAMLLGAAMYLAEMRDFAGTVHFIFQPAEENEGGGRVMVEEGIFDEFPVDAVFGMHNWPRMPTGEFAVAPGPMMAAFDVFTITIRGKGTHAAMPHHGIDPIVVASHVVTALQTVASRNTDPADQVVVTVAQIQAGDTWNVIPGEATLRGTARSFNESVQDMVETNMQRIVNGVCDAFGATADFCYERRYPATVNSEQESRWAAEIADEIVGPDNVVRNPTPCMGSEDFAFMLRERPGCYVWIGNGTEGANVHNPHYDFNDQILPVGASYWARLVENLL